MRQIPRDVVTAALSHGVRKNIYTAIDFDTQPQSAPRYSRLSSTAKESTPHNNTYVCISLFNGHLSRDAIFMKIWYI